VLKLALQYPGLVAWVFDDYDAEEFTHPAHAAVRRAIEAAGGINGPAAYGPDWITAVRDAAPDDRVRALVTELAVEAPRSPGVPDEIYAGDNLVRLRLFSADRSIAEVKRRLQRFDLTESGHEQQAVYTHLLELEAYRRRLLDGGAAAL
jgi:DNA primase